MFFKKREPKENQISSLSHCQFFIFCYMLPDQEHPNKWHTYHNNNVSLIPITKGYAHI